MAGRLYVTDGRIMLFNSLTPSGYEFREGGLPGGYSCGALAADCNVPDIMYAVVNGVLYKTTNGGQSWSSCFDPDGSVICVYANPTVQGEVWAGVSNDGVVNDEAAGVWKSTNYGASWTQKLHEHDDTFGSGCPANVITCVGTTVWAHLWVGIMASTRLRVSTDGGATWSPGYTSNTRLASHSQSAGTATHGVFASATVGYQEGPLVTTNNWSGYTDRSGVTGAGVMLVYDPAASYLLGVFGGNIQRSANGGASFSAVKASAYLQGMSMLTCTFMPGTPAVYHGGLSGHIFYSTDSGQSWNSFVTDRGNNILCILGTAEPYRASCAFKLVVA